jgi:putative membrane protein
MSEAMNFARCSFGFRHNPRYALGLLLVFLVVFVGLGLDPTSRSDWLLENFLTVLALAWAIWWYRRTPLSNLACTLLFVFGVLHEIGAHYQYSEVPYETWVAALCEDCSLDALFGFQRNQFDRLVHFLYGLLITPVAAEVIVSRVRLRGFWLFVLPVTFMMSHSLIYELIEWLAASVVAPEVGQAYLGTQGDVWDAQKGHGAGDAGFPDRASLVAVVPVAFCGRANPGVIAPTIAAAWDSRILAAYRMQKKGPALAGPC